MLKIFICGNVYQLIKTSMMKNLLVEMLYQITKRTSVQPLTNFHFKTTLHIFKMIMIFCGFVEFK